MKMFLGIISGIAMFSGIILQVLLATKLFVPAEPVLYGNLVQYLVFTGFGGIGIVIVIEAIVPLIVSAISWIVQLFSHKPTASA